MRIVAIISLLFACIIFLNFSKEGDPDEVEAIQVKEGNLILSGSQQPAPLFGFGQNIIGKNETQLYFYADSFKISTTRNSTFMPGILYGIKDNFSAYFNIPISQSSQILDGKHLKSLTASASLQFEYAYYSKVKKFSTTQATVLAALSGPNGSAIKQPIGRSNSSNFFIGGTLCRTSVDWYVYGSIGELFSLNKNNSGNVFLYQSGLGRNICHSKDWIYLFLVEALGASMQPNLISGVANANSGGNFIFIAPSIWVSSERLLLQFGVALPVYQKLNGNQGKYDYQIAFNCAWKF